LPIVPGFNHIKRPPVCFRGRSDYKIVSTIAMTSSSPAVQIGKDIGFSRIASRAWFIVLELPADIDEVVRGRLRHLYVHDGPHGNLQFLKRCSDFCRDHAPRRTHPTTPGHNLRVQLSSDFSVLRLETSDLLKLGLLPWAQEVWSSNLHAPTTFSPRKEISCRKLSYVPLNSVFGFSYLLPRTHESPLKIEERVWRLSAATLNGEYVELLDFQ
jgi:hypothetical protein